MWMCVCVCVRSCVCVCVCRRFFKCPNFEGWYYQRQREVNQKLQVLHMDALSNSVSSALCVTCNQQCALGDIVSQCSLREL